MRLLTGLNSPSGRRHLATGLGPLTATAVSPRRQRNGCRCVSNNCDARRAGTRRCRAASIQMSLAGKRRTSHCSGGSLALGERNRYRLASVECAKEGQRYAAFLAKPQRVLMVRRRHTL
eukprot:365940-Chlamydomonas_euryale.AAC.13